MSQPLAYKTVTLTATASAQNLFAALTAIDPTIVAYAREMNLQGDPGNSTNNVLIGDDQLSSSRLGVSLTAGSSRTYRSSGATRDVPVSDIWFLASGGSPKLNVELLT